MNKFTNKVIWAWKVCVFNYEFNIFKYQVLVIYVFQEIYPFYLSCQVNWHKIFHTITSLSFNACKIYCDIHFTSDTNSWNFCSLPFNLSLISLSLSLSFSLSLCYQSNKSFINFTNLFIDKLLISLIFTNTCLLKNSLIPSLIFVLFFLLLSLGLICPLFLMVED